MTKTFKKSLTNLYTLLDAYKPSAKKSFSTFHIRTGRLQARLVKKALEGSEQNQSKAALRLGISRGTLRKIMASYK